MMLVEYCSRKCHMLFLSRQIISRIAGLFHRSAFYTYLDS